MLDLFTFCTWTFSTFISRTTMSANLAAICAFALGSMSNPGFSTMLATMRSAAAFRSFWPGMVACLSKYSPIVTTRSSVESPMSCARLFWMSSFFVITVYLSFLFKLFRPDRPACLFQEKGGVRGASPCRPEAYASGRPAVAYGQGAPNLCYDIHEELWTVERRWLSCSVPERRLRGSLPY